MQFKKGDKVVLPNRMQNAIGIYLKPGEYFIVKNCVKLADDFYIYELETFDGIKVGHFYENRLEDFIDENGMSNTLFELNKEIEESKQLKINLLDKLDKKVNNLKEMREKMIIDGEGAVKIFELGLILQYYEYLRNEISEI